MAQIAALRCGKLGQSLDDEIALTPITWRTAQRVPGLAGNLRCEAVRGHDSGAGSRQPLQRYAARKAAPTDQVRSLTLAQGNLTVLWPSCSCYPLEAEFVAGRQSSQDLRRRASALRGAGWCQYRDCRWRILLSAWPLRLRKIDAAQYPRRV